MLTKLKPPNRIVGDPMARMSAFMMPRHGVVGFKTPQSGPGGQMP
jgi:hypothetical protein